MPLLDFCIGKDSSNPPKRVLAVIENDPIYRYSTYLFVLLQFALVISASAIVGLAGLSWGLTTTVGMLSGLSINTAHELGHKNTRLERWLARIALAPVAYGYFYVEHNFGHHQRVATPEDPASARLGESFWAILSRTVLGSVRSAWQIERRRLARRGYPALSVHNSVLRSWAITAALWLALATTFGASVLAFVLLQAVIGASMLEAVNYCEHYGGDIRRANIQPGHEQRMLSKFRSPAACV